MALFQPTDGAVLGSVLEIRRSWHRWRFGAKVRARIFQWCFAIPAILIATYATVLSDEAVGWQTVLTYCVCALCVIWPIVSIASMIERCEREARRYERSRTFPSARQRGVQHVRSQTGAEQRVAHLERAFVRQHRFVSDVAHELRT